MFEVYYRQLLSNREEFWQLTSLKARNNKLNRMVLYANSCGVDLVEFIQEYEGEKAALEFAKAKIVLQKQTEKQEEKQKATFKCPFCKYHAESSKSLSGHLKRHSPKYEVFNLKAQTRAV